MSDKDKKTLDAIEETQAELRESIETAKKLADQSEKLIKRHREEMEKGD